MIMECKMGVLGRGILFGVAFVMCLAVARPCVAGNWPHWRGPHYDGSSDETGLPATWSATENVLWAAPMPGRGSATPIVWDDKVFVASTGADVSTLIGLCLDRDSGKVLWSKKLVSKGAVPRRNTAASSSPVTDGHGVYFLFGTSDLFGFDMTGKMRWSVHLAQMGAFTTKFGYSGSPLLHEGKLYVAVLRTSGSSEGHMTDEGSYLLCVEAATGGVLWKVRRRSEANDESLDAYTSPVPLQTDKGLQIVVTGANYVTGHEAKTGAEVWRHGFNPENEARWRLVPTPVVRGGTVFASQPRNKEVYAFRPADSGVSSYASSLWAYKGQGSDVPSPLYYKGRLYVLNDRRKTLTCLNPETGERLWEGALGGGAPFFASATAGDGKLYCMNRDGDVVVLKAGDAFEVLGRMPMGGEACEASIALAQGKIFIRTSEKLYCIARGDAANTK